MRYIDIKKDMDVDFWTQPVKGKRITAIDVDEPASGSGRVIYTGPHFVTVQLQSGRKITITRNDLITDLAKMRPMKKVSGLQSLFESSAMP